MTCGSAVLEGYVPDMDATVVSRILDAGAEIVAPLNMDNFAYSAGGETSAYGPTLNPHNHEHLAGGSSGGSAAALRYDSIDLTIGCDQGGSIRVPASWCGGWSASSPPMGWCPILALWGSIQRLIMLVR